CTLVICKAIRTFHPAKGASHEVFVVSLVGNTNATLKGVGVASGLAAPFLLGRYSQIRFCHLPGWMAASVRQRPKRCTARNERDVPTGDITPLGCSRPETALKLYWSQTALASKSQTAVISHSMLSQRAL